MSPTYIARKRGKRVQSEVVRDPRRRAGESIFCAYKVSPKYLFAITIGHIGSITAFTEEHIRIMAAAAKLRFTAR